MFWGKSINMLVGNICIDLAFLEQYAPVWVEDNSSLSLWLSLTPLSQVHRKVLWNNTWNRECFITVHTFCELFVRCPRLAFRMKCQSMQCYAILQCGVATNSVQGWAGFCHRLCEVEEHMSLSASDSLSCKERWHFLFLSLYSECICSVRGAVQLFAAHSLGPSSVSTSAALPWESSLIPTLWWEQQLSHLRNVVCRCKFFLQNSSEREWIGAIVSSLPASLSNMCTLSLLWIIRPSSHLIQPLYHNTHEVSHQANKQITRDSPGQTPDKGSETQWHPHSFFLSCKINQTYTLNRQVALKRNFPRLSESWEGELRRLFLLVVYCWKKVGYTGIINLQMERNICK